AALIDRLEQAIAASMTVDGRRIATTASIGIAFWHPQANSGDELLRSADEAAYQAKARGRARHVFFSEEMETRSRSRARIAAELPLALDRAQFALAFQPIRDLASLRCVGSEALV